MSNAERLEDNTIRYALWLQRRWRAEIEEAIDKVKKSKKQSAGDRWFKTMWYEAQASNHKMWQNRDCPE